MIVGHTFIHIHTLLRIGRIYIVSSIADTQVSSILKIVTPVLASSSLSIDLFLAPSSVVTTTLITSISTVVLKIANVVPGNAAMVGALEFGEYAGTRSCRTDGHVVLIAKIIAMLHPIAYLIPWDAFVVVALELLDFVAGEVFA